MNRYVSEIFGYPALNKDKEVIALRESFTCPFINDTCDPVNKKSNLTDDEGNLLIKHQTGACSVLHMHRGLTVINPVIICPCRFFEKDEDGRLIVFDYIKKKFFNDKNLILVSEIGLGTFGRADGILCQVSSNKLDGNKIHDYAHLEIQSDATTSTRDLVLCVKDFFNDVDITEKNYSYGLNSKASIKGSSLQMIDKGNLFKHFKKRSIWVLQDSLFFILCSVYNVEMTDITQKKPNEEENLIFVVVKSEYVEVDKKYKIKVDKCFSTSPNKLQKALSQKEPIKEEVIINSVRRKIVSKNFRQL